MKKKGKERKKEINKHIKHAQATYCTHKQQLYQLRKMVPQPQ